MWQDRARVCNTVTDNVTVHHYVETVLSSSVGLGVTLLPSGSERSGDQETVTQSGHTVKPPKRCEGVNMVLSGYGWGTGCTDTYTD